MKKILIVLILSLIMGNLWGQAGIKIFTKLEEAKFIIVFDGEVENTIPIKEITYDSLDYKKPHEVVISFTADSIADIEEEYYLLKDQVREFEILKKQVISKKAAKFGRKVGKLLKIGKHDKEGVLYDVFYLEERTKSEYLND